MIKKRAKNQIWDFDLVFSKFFLCLSWILFLFFILEKGEGREKEWETNINRLSLVAGDQTGNQESNQ